MLVFEGEVRVQTRHRRPVGPGHGIVIVYAEVQDGRGIVHILNLALHDGHTIVVLGQGQAFRGRHEVPVVVGVAIDVKQDKGIIITLPVRRGGHAVGPPFLTLGKTAGHGTAGGGHAGVTLGREVAQTFHGVVAEVLAPGHRLFAVAGAVVVGIDADGQSRHSVLLFCTGAGNLDLDPNEHFVSCCGELLGVGIRPHGIVASLVRSVDVGILREDVRLGSVHDHVDIKLVDVLAAVFKVAHAAGIETDAHLAQRGYVHGRRVEDLAVRAVLVVPLQVDVPVVVNELWNAVGENGAGRAQDPIAIGGGVFVARRAEIGSVERGFVFEALRVEDLSFGVPSQ